MYSEKSLKSVTLNENQVESFPNSAKNHVMRWVELSKLHLHKRTRRGRYGVSGFLIYRPLCLVK